MTMPKGILDEISILNVTATGPGGQNVNKVATAVTLRFDVLHSEVLSEKQKNRLFSLAGKRMDKHGILTITARRFRYQQQNRNDAIHRLENLIERSSRVEKSRISTRPTISSIQKRLESKKIRSKLKHNRKSNSSFDL